MKFFQQIGLRFRRPAFQIQYWSFGLLGIVVLLIANSSPWPNKFWQDFLVDISVVFFGVALVQFVWDKLGGDPLTKMMQVLIDVGEGNLGIERIWPKREIWMNDNEEGLIKWHKWVCKAKQVEIVSNTFWINWLEEEEFRKMLLKGIQKKDLFRLLIYDPESDLVRMRAADEKEIAIKGNFEMQNEIIKALKELAEGINSMGASSKQEIIEQMENSVGRWKEIQGMKEGPEKERKHEEMEKTSKGLEIRMTSRCLHFAQVIRADNQMLVTFYLSGKSGKPCPTMQLRGPRTEYFERYSEQFKILWRRGRALTFVDLEDLVSRFTV